MIFDFFRKKEIRSICHEIDFDVSVVIDKDSGLPMRDGYVLKEFIYETRSGNTWGDIKFTHTKSRYIIDEDHEITKKKRYLERMKYLGMLGQCRREG